MFKICVAIILQILQFSTDERTLEAMKVLSGPTNREKITEEVNWQDKLNSPRLHPACDAILLQPMVLESDRKKSAQASGEPEHKNIKVVFA